MIKDREKLFIAQAFLNAVGDMCSTKDPDNLRGRVSQEYKDLYAETGARSFDAMIDGQKVGTFSLTISKPTDGKTARDFVVSDPEAFKRWNDFDAVAYNYALEHLQEVADWTFGMTGEIPDGCEMQTYEVAGSPGGEVTRTTLKVDAEKVAEVLGNRLPEAAMLLLEGGSDD